MKKEQNLKNNAEPQISGLEKQFDKIKNKHPKHIVWLRMDGFVHCIKEDAILINKVLGCTITKRPDNGMEISGFNDNMLDEYLPKMIKEGYPVAMCDL
jgi:DNA mismatch repair protein MutS